MTGADFEKLDVYRAAIELVITADAIVSRLPAGRAYLIDQLRRAATSVVLNIAEGSGEYSKLDKARFYRMARRSGYECIAVLDIMSGVRIGDATEIHRARDVLDRIGAMLTKMITNTEKHAPGFVRENEQDEDDYLPGSGSGSSRPDSDSGAARLDSDSDSQQPTSTSRPNSPSNSISRSSPEV